MKKHNDWIHKTVNNPYIQFSVGIVLLLTIILDSFILSFNHGIIFLSLYHISQALSNLLQSLEHIDKFKKK